MGSHLLIDADACVGCGLCVQVCIRDNIAVADGRAVELDSGACFDCGHCAAVCPKGAVTVLRFRDAASDPALPDMVADGDSLQGLLMTRRSCRWFTDEPVTDPELSALFRAAGFSPTAQNAMDVEFAVVQDRLEEFLLLLADILEPLGAEFPRIAQFVRYMGSRDRRGPNPFLWEGRTVILAFSGEPVNAAIAMSRVELMAHANGLGGFYSLWMSKADALDHGRLMSFFPGIDPGKRLGAVYVVGHPRVRYRRMAPRPEPVVHRYRSGKRSGAGAPWV